MKELKTNVLKVFSIKKFIEEQFTIDYKAFQDTIKSEIISTNKYYLVSDIVSDIVKYGVCEDEILSTQDIIDLALLVIYLIDNDSFMYKGRIYK